MNIYLRNAKFLLAETAHDRLPMTSESEVAFVGRSNVGKSSLICALTMNSKLARVSKTPGLTRAINVFEAKPGKWIVDLPGYGYAVGPKRAINYWPEMIGRYLSERAMMKRVYVLIDSDVGATKLDVGLVEWLNEKKVPYKIVGTKTDRVGRDKHATHRQKIATALGVLPADMLWVSSKEGFGVQALQTDVVAELGL